MVDGEPNRRPTWYFDIREQGEGLADVSVHLVDQMLWTMFPGFPIDYRSDVEMLSARRWPTRLTLEQFTRVTGESEFPEFLDRWVENGELSYYCNGQLEYAVRDIRARHDVGWEYEAEAYGDEHRAIYRGDRSEVQLRQEPETRGRSELYIVPRDASIGDLKETVQKRLHTLDESWSGVRVEELDGRLHVAIPDGHRVSHEAHFNRLAERFVSLVKNPAELPSWERSQLAAKYYITTRAVKRSRVEQ
jgi:predicted dehydrogenase